MSNGHYKEGNGQFLRAVRNFAALLFACLGLFCSEEQFDNPLDPFNDTGLTIRLAGVAGNNQLASSPDLIISGITAPTSVSRLTNFTVTVTVTNQGGGDVVDPTCCVDYGFLNIVTFLSVDSVLEHADNIHHYVKHDIVAKPIAGFSSVQIEVTQSTSLAAGPYYVGAKVNCRVYNGTDCSDTAPVWALKPESNQSNNWSEARAITVNP